MTQINEGLVEGPQFLIDASQDPLSISCGACGDGAWLERDAIAGWVGRHAEQCMAEILDEEFPEDGDDE